MMGGFVGCLLAARVSLLHRDVSILAALVSAGWWQPVRP